MEKKRITTKKWIIVFLLVVFVGVILFLIYKRSIIGDLSQTREIKIRVFSSITGDTYKDIIISDEEIVQEICDVFSGLELKKYRSYCKPYDVSYELHFMDENGVKIDIISVVLGGDRIDCAGNQYTIVNDINLQDYLTSLITEE